MCSGQLEVPEGKRSSEAVEIEGWEWDEEC